VAAKNKTVRGTLVEALEMGGLGGPKRTIYNILGQTVTIIFIIIESIDTKKYYYFLLQRHVEFDL